MSKYYICRHMVESLYLTYHNSEIHYIKYGHGSKTIVCLHGYGEAAISFEVLCKNLPQKEYTLYAIDLPFHGSTKWDEKAELKVDDLLEIISVISCSYTHITLVGFSIGARLALSVYEMNPALCNKLVLIAPDGLHVNFWYWFSTRTFFGEKVFKSIVFNPGWLLNSALIAKRLRLLNRTVYSLVCYYLKDIESRKHLYDTWTAYKIFAPNLHSIKSSIVRHETNIRLIFGKLDQIILSKRGEMFVQGIERYSKVCTLLSGHRILNERYSKEIADLIIQ